MRLNVRPANPHRTYEGAPALAPKNPLAELRRAVASCLLWEDQFYEDGVAIADRIASLVSVIDTADVAALAVEARTAMKLRHAPLWLLAGLAKAGKGAPASAYTSVIQRANEMGELISMHWRDGKRPLPAAMKRGIAAAFAKFDAYRLGKYNRKVAVTLKDVLRLVHPKPANDEQAALWKSIIDGTLASPDTWEVALSGGADKKETFERLLRAGDLGYLALLRNLRNMQEAGCDRALVRGAILARKGAHNVLPFRYVAAARAAPQFEPALDEALCASIETLPVLLGQTVVLVDISGSMSERLSGKSDLRRVEAAAALASIIPGDVRLFIFNTGIAELPPRRGMAGVAQIVQAVGGGTYLGAAVNHINANVSYDRLIVITDEQSADAVGSPKGRGYMLNVGAYKNGVGYGPWTRIDGFSENVLRFINEHEANDD